MTQIDTIIAEIKSAMDEKGITSYRVAKDTGISEASLSRFFKGIRGLSSENLLVLLDYLGYELAVKKKGK